MLTLDGLLEDPSETSFVMPVKGVIESLDGLLCSVVISCFVEGNFVEKSVKEDDVLVSFSVRFFWLFVTVTDIEVVVVIRTRVTFPVQPPGRLHVVAVAKIKSI